MIRKHVKADGSASYTAQVRIKRGGKTVFSESKTFERESVAKGWLARRRHELDQPGALERATAPNGTLSDAIDLYTGDVTAIGRTKAQVLRSLKDFPIAEMAMSEIRAHHVVELARQLSGDNRKPQTVQNYLSHLGGIFSIARSAYGYDVDADTVNSAIETTRRLGLTRKSAKRDRRPSADEMDRIMEHFAGIQHRRPASNPMHIICAIAMFSTRRQEELLKMRWDDLDVKHSRILVRDMKHPGAKVGNHTWCDLPPEALRIIETLPKTDARILPYSTDAVSAAFTRACAFLEIQDMHFHDLRHEGVSRLFEMGWNIPRVAGVSGHRSWQSLQRYSHLRQTGDKWSGWDWLDRLAPPPAPGSDHDVPTDEGDELPPKTRKRRSG
ncbi:site-specific integrase [Cereibacter sediminicola]|uniref:site-specific integrase n=1 Tax=Cereibacter sediminicola TaxID=2584941 RepID=UPI0011A12BD9|nr:site-specific integrase [Cereibacter sediminicola]